MTVASPALAVVGGGDSGGGGDYGGGGDGRGRGGGSGSGGDDTTPAPDVIDYLLRFCILGAFVHASNELTILF